MTKEQLAKKIEEVQGHFWFLFKRWLSNPSKKNFNRVVLQGQLTIGEEEQLIRRYHIVSDGLPDPGES